MENSKFHLLINSHLVEFAVNKIHNRKLLIISMIINFIHTYIIIYLRKILSQQTHTLDDPLDTLPREVRLVNKNSS